LFIPKFYFLSNLPLSTKQLIFESYEGQFIDKPLLQYIYATFPAYILGASAEFTPIFGVICH
jgi:hypothetical protein